MAKTKHKPEDEKQAEGRPRKYATPAALSKKVNDYFRSLRRTKANPIPRPPTLSGLSVYLDFADFSTFKDYEGDDAFSHILKKARMRIQVAHEERLFAQACTGSIFWLKCNGGDMFKEQAQEHKIETTVKSEHIANLAHLPLEDQRAILEIIERAGEQRESDGADP